MPASAFSDDLRVVSDNLGLVFVATAFADNAQTVNGFALFG